MSDKYIVPKFWEGAFTCPLCKQISRQNWRLLIRSVIYPPSALKPVPSEEDKEMVRYSESMAIVGQEEERAYVSECQGCGKSCVWVGEKMIYPNIGIAPQPNDDLSEEVKKIYSEAALVLPHSPRAAAALLRLALQEFCKELGSKGNNLAEDIENLVKNHNLSEEMKEVMDTVRYVGNNAVHPGEIDLNDTRDIVEAMFEFINYIAERMISAPKARKSMIARVKKLSDKPSE